MAVIFVIIVLAAVISIAWASGIHSMHRDHPDYKGEDFLDWDDENKIHTESDFK
jgi:hypothetical protein